MIQVSDDLRLRLFNSSDASDLFSLVDRNRSYLREWLPWLDFQKSAQDASDFIEGSIERWKKKVALVLAVVNRDSICGVVSFNTIDLQSGHAAIGYWVGEESQGRGIVTQSISALIDYGFEELLLTKITINCAENNKKSIAVAKRLGFSYLKREENKEWLYDHYVNHLVYQISKP